MESQILSEQKSRISFSKKVAPEIKDLSFETSSDTQMTSSVLSVTSSLTSPVDSGVQLLDSESDITSVMSNSDTTCDLESNTVNTKCVKETFKLEQTSKVDTKELLAPIQNVMTNSDIVNQNTTLPCDFPVYSSSAPNVNYKIDLEQNKEDSVLDSKIELELTTNVDIKPDINEKSENSNNVMHVSMSEEVKETPKIDEQIVFRRQRKKKSSKSDTPKKRVSFHEDILNSTKIDDIHINHGFITHQQDVPLGFFNWNSIRKRDVVQGRYSWAAEGDTPYYERNIPEREVKSEIFINSRYSSTSSSSTGSVDSSSNNSLCDGESNNVTPKLPRSSCLKKRPPSKRIDTQIVQEDIGTVRQRKSESNLLDSNIFGSLKNILSFSTSVPLAERGVPEGQEDVEFHSCSQNSASKRRSFSLSYESMSKSLDKNDRIPEGTKKIGNLNIEAYYPSYPTTSLPANVILCDSNVYEHKGITYSSEYDKFQKSLESVKSQKPKSSTIYQMLVQDLNFFKKKEKELSENNLKALAEGQSQASTPSSDCKTSKKSNRLSITEWSDTETVSDLSENISKHLSSPKHKINKSNHYSIQNFNKNSDVDSKLDDIKFTLRPTSSKNSLIGRFLRNVTMKKLLDAKLQKKQKIRINKCMGLYVKGIKPDESLCKDLDKELEEEILNRSSTKVPIEEKLGSAVILKLKKEIFRNPKEKLINYYKVHSAYTSSGDSKPLVLFLTNTTLYITGLKPNQSFINKFVLPYPELNTILIGPDSHLIHFSNSDKEMQFIITTGSAQITGNIIGELEMAIRKSRKYPVLPAVRHLTMREMVQLKNAICKHTTVDKDEEYFHYSIVNVQDTSLELDCTPLGPVKKGPLMFKTSANKRWETGYFILKGGVLYILSSPSNRLPLQALPLGGGACLGAHRTPYCLRPHTFELLLDSLTLHLAAPDEYVASEWLQVLIQAASGAYNSEINHTQSCTLLLTSHHILTMREKFPSSMPYSDFKAQTLSCAAISDLTSFRIPLAEQSWCILEFSCTEVHETSGDLIIYFETNSELERFISTLELLWTYNNTKDESFPISTISENDVINKRCEDTYRSLQNAWSSVSLILK